MPLSYLHQLTGELSLATVASAGLQLKKLPVENELIIDFAQVSRVDSSALIYIFAAQRLAKEKNWQLQLINLPEEIYKLADVYDVRELIINAH